MNNSGVAWHDRVLALGYTGAGKSELLNVIWSGLACQRLLIDPKDEFTVADVEPVRSVDGLDWSRPVLHFIPGPTTDLREWERLFEACYSRRHLSVCCHELAFVVGHQPARAGPYVNTYLSQGRAHGLGLLGGSTRPVLIPTYAGSEPQHVFAFVPRLARQDDHRAIADMMGLSAEQLGQELGAALANTGPYSFLWYERATSKLTSWGPLPERLRRSSIVTRRTVA